MAGVRVLQNTGDTTSQVTASQNNINSGNRSTAPLSKWMTGCTEQSDGHNLRSFQDAKQIIEYVNAQQSNDQCDSAERANEEQFV